MSFPYWQGGDGDDDDPWFFRHIGKLITIAMIVMVVLFIIGVIVIGHFLAKWW